VWLLGNGDHRSLVLNTGDVVARPSVDSAFSLPPSRALPPSGDRPLPVAARPRDDERPTKPRIWSLAEVATSGDCRPKRADHGAVSAGFRPWSTAEDPETITACRKPAEVRVGAYQAAFITAGNLSATPATRWHRNNADNVVSSHVAD